ncbi:MAG: cupin [Anaerolineae bacterium]|nr:cupin [Anaerolineae bacterium]
MAAVSTQSQARLVRWRGGQHPTLEAITRLMHEERLRPYVWVNAPNCRLPVRSHGYAKTLFCVQGSLEIAIPDTRQRIMLGAGDRLDLPRGMRYSTIVGPSGAQCVEGSPA